MWGTLDILLTLLMLSGVGGGLVWAAYAFPRGLALESISSLVVTFGFLILWISLENRGKSSRLNRRCPACGQRLRLDREKGLSIAPATAECRWCGRSFRWKAPKSRFGAGRWQAVSPPKPRDPDIFR